MNWKHISLGEIAEFRNGINYSQSNIGTGVKVVGVANFRDNVLVPYDELEEINPDGVLREGDLLQDGDIVFVRSNGNPALVGRCLFVVDCPSDITHSGFTIRTRIKDEHALPEFYAQFFRSGGIKGALARDRRGTNITNLSQGMLAGLIVPLPPLSEQRKIAAVLSVWDEAIASAERLIAVLRERKRGLMQRLLTGRVRFPEFMGTVWQKRELRDCVELVSRVVKVQPGQHYNLIGVRWYFEGAHIHDTIAGDTVVTQELTRIHENDIVYNKMWVTKAAFAIAKAEHHGTYGTNEYPTFTAKSNLDVRFLEYAFHDPRFLHEARALCRGTTGRARLNPEDFLKLKVHLPDKPEQSKIAAVLGTAQHEIDQAQRHVHALKEQKRGLMQRLLTGQVRVR
jgi:type I restriction enzyme, S subunit